MYTKVYNNVQFKQKSHKQYEAYGAVGALLIMSAEGMEEQEVTEDTLMGWRIDFRDWKTLIGRTFTFHYSSEEGERYSNNKYDVADEKDELCYVTVEGIPYYDPFKKPEHDCDGGNHEPTNAPDEDGYCVCSKCGQVVKLDANGKEIH